jgi:hypothetical protein
METSALFEARYAPWFYPAGTGNRPGHPVEQETGPSQIGLRWRGESPVD